MHRPHLARRTHQAAVAASVLALGALVAPPLQATKSAPTPKPEPAAKPARPVLAIARPTPFSVGQIGATAPAGWSVQAPPKTDRKTQYDLFASVTGTVLRARADGSAASLRHSLYADPARTPMLRWRWRTERMLQGADMTRKQGDDHVAKLCVFFDRDGQALALKDRAQYTLDRFRFGNERARLPRAGQVSADQTSRERNFPAATVCYVWDNRQPVGAVLEKPNTPFVAMVVVASGESGVGRWASLERNVVEDYQRAFQSQPPQITGVSVATETDDTGETAVTYFGDIEFVGR